MGWEILQPLNWTPKYWTKFCLCPRVQLTRTLQKDNTILEHFCPLPSQHPAKLRRLQSKMQGLIEPEDFKISYFVVKNSPSHWSLTKYCKTKVSDISLNLVLPNDYSGFHTLVSPKPVTTVVFPHSPKHASGIVEGNGHFLTYPSAVSLHIKTELNSVALVRERTIPTERPPPVGEISANFCV